jgi:exodeoxyribonuclease VII small subunit
VQHRKGDSVTDKPANGEIAALPFEKALAQLEEIVGQLEKGSVPLEESIAIYERGEALKKHCETLLRNAEMRIEKITLGTDGKPTGLAPLDIE